MHRAEQAAAENASHAQHVERVHQDVVLGLEHEHEVEGPADPQGHPVGERTLPNRVDQEDGGGGGDRGAVGDADPGAHP